MNDYVKIQVKTIGLDLKECRSDLFDIKRSP